MYYLLRVNRRKLFGSDVYTRVLALLVTRLEKAMNIPFQFANINPTVPQINAPLTPVTQRLAIIRLLQERGILDNSEHRPQVTTPAVSSVDFHTPFSNTTAAQQPVSPFGLLNPPVCLNSVSQHHIHNITYPVEESKEAYSGGVSEAKLILALESQPRQAHQTLPFAADKDEDIESEQPESNTGTEQPRDLQETAAGGDSEKAELEPGTEETEDKGKKKKGSDLRRPLTKDMFKQTNRFSRSSTHSTPYDRQPQSTQQNAPVQSHKSDQVTKAILEFYHENKQSNTMYQRKQLLRDMLYRVVGGVFPDCGLYITGSSISGYGINSSDMDLSLIVSKKILSKRQGAVALQLVAKALAKHSDFLEKVRVIPARVPIMVFKDRLSGVECDMSINNEDGIRNTHLLHAYAQLDERVTPLVIYVKRWAKFHNINDAKNGTISSYSLVLLVINFLQVGVSPPVLPCLQTLYPERFDPTIDIRLLTVHDDKSKFNYTSRNNMNLGELFEMFLVYYGYNFDFASKAACVREGAVIERRQAISESHEMRQWKELCVQEPFNLSNTAHSVFDHRTFIHVQHVFRISSRVLRISKDCSKLFNYPF